MSRTGRPANVNYNTFTIFYSDGEMVNGKKMAKEITEAYVRENDKRYYTFYDRKRTMHVPNETARYITLSKIGGTFSNVTCAHCKKEIVMLFQTIRNEEMEQCPLCNRNIYDKEDKKVRKVW